MNALIRGVDFIKKNPQILYTIFLIVVIPLSYFYTSQNFLESARVNQDRSERSRIGMLEDIVAVFIPELLNDKETLHARLAAIHSANETIRSFRIVKQENASQYRILDSLDENEIDTTTVLSQQTLLMLGAAQANVGQSFAGEFYVDNDRYWRAVEAVNVGTDTRVFLLADISMAEADYLAERNIVSAYIVLMFVIICIVLLLIRHARIIDYAALYKRLEEVDHMKDDFVSMAAHELRSPLTIIRGYTEMLGAGEGLSDAGKEHLQNIDNAAQQLNVLVGDILDVAKLQEGRMSFAFTLFDPASLIESVVHGFVQPAKSKSLELSCEINTHAEILVDTDRLRQVLINLIGNAVKYTSAGSVRVTTNIVNGQYEIRVSDTGMGISAEDQQHMFEKFFRVKNAETAKIQGTGLGLWITAQIIRQMKGEITLESIRGKGSDFIVRFPVRK